MEEITEEEFICFEEELEQHRIQILNQMDLLEEEYNEEWENIANRREEELRAHLHLEYGVEIGFE